MTNKQRAYWESHPDLIKKDQKVKDTQESKAEDNKVKLEKGEKSDDSTTESILG